MLWLWCSYNWVFLFVWFFEERFIARPFKENKWLVLRNPELLLLIQLDSTSFSKTAGTIFTFSYFTKDRNIWTHFQDLRRGLEVSASLVSRSERLVSAAASSQLVPATPLRWSDTAGRSVTFHSGGKLSWLPAWLSCLVLYNPLALCVRCLLTSFHRIK